MNLIWIGGSHPRHLFFANTIQKEFNLAGSIIEKREKFIPLPPEDVDQHDRENFVKHFKNRDLAEKKFFGKQDYPNCPILEISKEELNTRKTIDFIKSKNPDVVLTFGCHLIKEPLYSNLPKHTVNLHGGLSPRYRGVATMFWPFYFLEPNHVGGTFHYIISEPDAGSIIHQSIPNLEYNDKIHDVACKTIISASNDALKLLKIFNSNRKWNAYKQTGTGKNFLERDFRPEHLRVIYDLFNDAIVDLFLDGKIKPTSPKLVRQF